MAKRQKHKTGVKILKLNTSSVTYGLSVVSLEQALDLNYKTGIIDYARQPPEATGCTLLNSASSDSIGG